MLESTQKGDYTFFYIHPNDYQMPETPVPADFRADYPEDDVWPENVFSEEPAIVHFKALNYKKGMDAKISQQKEGLNTNVHYLELADVAPENTLHCLLDRYKGKVCLLMRSTMRMEKIPTKTLVSQEMTQENYLRRNC